MTPEALARPNGTGWHQCDRELRIGESTYFCSGDNGHGGWHSFMFDDEALAALTPAPAQGARCKHGYPMTCPHYDCRPTPPPPEPEGELVAFVDRMIASHERGCGCAGGMCEYFGINQIRRIAALARTRVK